MSDRKGVRIIYVFYADVFLLQNLCMDYIAVWGSNLLLKRKKGGMRLFIVSLLSSVIGLLLLLLVRSEALYQILTHFILNTGLVLGCFGIDSKKYFLENWMVTYFVVILLGGGMEWLQEQRILSRWSFMQMIVVTILLFSFVAYLLQIRSFGRYVLPGKLRKDTRELKVRIYYDSGNQLRDPYTGKGVSILGFEQAKKFCDTARDAIRLVPYRSLGEKNGLLRVIDVDMLEIIQNNRKVIVKNAVIGIAEEGVLEGKEYDLILHGALLDENKVTENKKTKMRSEEKIKSR